MTTTPAFRASGLASGLDTTNIVNELVKIESRTIDIARRQQDAFKSQLSALGEVMSKLSSLRTAATGLGTKACWRCARRGPTPASRRAPRLLP
jgi:flagellar hook-associated protein 2